MKFVNNNSLVTFSSVNLTKKCEITHRTISQNNTRYGIYKFDNRWCPIFYTTSIIGGYLFIKIYLYIYTRKYVDFLNLLNFNILKSNHHHNIFSNWFSLSLSLSTPPPSIILLSPPPTPLPPNSFVTSRSRIL